jgi:hypothetical protein
MRQRHRAAISLALLLAAGRPTAFSATPGQTTFYKVGHFSGSNMGPDFHIYQTMREGIGVVYGTFSETDRELIVHQNRSEASTIVAYVDYKPMSDGGWEIIFEANEPGLISELKEVTSEYSGLVVDLTNSGWARVAYGYTPKGEVRFGWVKLVPDRVSYISYNELIQTQAAYFVDPEKVVFFDAPKGRRVSFSLVPAGGNYASYELTVLKIEGDWIEVGIEVPSTHPCSDYANAKVQRSRRAWVQKYNSDGRYQIWYVHDSC